MSWRNPDEAQGHFDFDTYARAVLEARDAVAAIAGQETVHLNAACSGGIITAGAVGTAGGERGSRGGREPDVARLRARQRALGDGVRVHQPRAGRGGGRRVGAQGLRRRAGAGGRVRVAAAERPGVGLRRSTTTCSARRRRRSTSSTGTRTPSGSRRGCTATSCCCRWRTRWRGPARWRSSGRRSTSARSTSTATSSPASTTTSSRGRTPTAAPRCWAARTRFVLSTSGHIQALINPPSEKSRASYRVAEDRPAEAQAFLEQTPTERGSWWPDYVAVAARALRRAQARAGQARRPQAQGAGQGARQLRPRELRRA